MSETTLLLITLSRAVFLITNIFLQFSFLKTNRSIWFQAIAFAGTTALWYALHIVLQPILPDPFLLGYVTALLYLIPIVLVFQETIHAKLFVFFLIFSLSPCVFLSIIYVEVLVFHHVVGGLLLSCMMLELASIPLIRRYITPHVRNILVVINQQNPIFTFFPILSFILVAVYGVQRIYSLPSFISLLLTIIMILFSYYLISISLEQTKRNQQLAVTARTDKLTGLYNRHHMEKRIEEEYQQYQKSGVEFALIMADIDLFKEINDHYGHDGGDWLLQSVSDDLRKAVREHDEVARWGGDEFLLLLPATNSKSAVKLAERIGSTVKKRKYAYENKDLSVTLTLGVSVISRDDTVASIIKKADVVMYQGKRLGRNCVLSFDSIANTDISENP